MSQYITGRIGAKNRTYIFSSTAVVKSAEEEAPVRDIPRQQVQEAGQTAGRKQTPGTGGRFRLKPALEHIHEHFRERLMITDMAKLCWISADYFSRLFKQETGSTFSSYINGLRIEAAKRCLVEGAESVVSIAYSLGYEDSGYFIRTFKKSTGETPAVYRLKKREGL